MKLAKPVYIDPVSDPKQNKYLILKKHPTVVIVAIEMSGVCVNQMLR